MNLDKHYLKINWTEEYERRSYFYSIPELADITFMLHYECELDNIYWNQYMKVYLYRGKETDEKIKERMKHEKLEYKEYKIMQEKASVDYNNESMIY